MIHLKNKNGLSDRFQHGYNLNGMFRYTNTWIIHEHCNADCGTTDRTQVSVCTGTCVAMPENSYEKVAKRSSIHLKYSLCLHRIQFMRVQCLQLFDRIVVVVVYRSSICTICNCASQSILVLRSHRYLVTPLTLSHLTNRRLNFVFWLNFKLKTMRMRMRTKQTKGEDESVCRVCVRCDGQVLICIEHVFHGCVVVPYPGRGNVSERIRNAHAHAFTNRYTKANGNSNNCNGALHIVCAFNCEAASERKRRNAAQHNTPSTRSSSPIRAVHNHCVTTSALPVQHHKSAVSAYELLRLHRTPHH